jgi:hypothetical protein
MAADTLEMRESKVLTTAFREVTALIASEARTETVSTRALRAEISDSMEV